MSIFTGVTPFGWITIDRSNNTSIVTINGWFTINGSEATQFLRPSIDISTGGWSPSSGTTLYENIDETIYNDTDYISNSTAGTCEVKLTSGNMPISGMHIINFRAKNNGSGSLTVQLYSGTTLISTYYVASLTSTYENFAWTLSEYEISSITNYNDLRLRFSAG